jgi:D-glycero-D-manno-heptose 1,7-bisphosphate phosphatase
LNLFIKIEWNADVKTIIATGSCTMVFCTTERMIDVRYICERIVVIMTHKALFLDRDGVINQDVAYPYKPEQIVFIDGIFDLCRKALAKGYLLIVVTNQAGVAKGYFNESDVKKLHAWMKDQFLKQTITITAFYYCPYHKNGSVELYRKDSNWRKPKPGMILQAVQDWDIDLASSLMVGDKKSDRIELPELKSIIVKSAYTPEDYDVQSLNDVETML